MNEYKNKLFHIARKDELFEMGLRLLYDTAYKFLDAEHIINNEILDIGCGTGTFLDYVNCSYFRYTGIDISRVNIEKARRKHGRTFKVMSAEKLKFKDNSFDKIVCIELIEHLFTSELIAVLREMDRVLKPGGIAVISTPNLSYLWSYLPWSLFPFKRRAGLAQYREGKRDGAYEENHPDFPVHFRFDREFIIDVIRLYTNFDIEDVTTTFWYNNRYMSHIPKFIQRWLHKSLRGWRLGAHTVIKCKKR